MMQLLKQFQYKVCLQSCLSLQLWGQLDEILCFLPVRNPLDKSINGVETRIASHITLFPRWLFGVCMVLVAVTLQKLK